MINGKMLGLGQNSSVIRELFEYGRKRKQEIGEDKVFDFSLGNPSVPAPETVNKTATELLDGTASVELHGYTPAVGDTSVREAIAQYIKKEHKFPADKSLIYMTAGAAASLCITLNALVCEGEEVVTIAPFFPEYKVFVEHTGASLVPVLAKTDDFQIDFDALEKAFCSRTAAIIINSPNNPTGAVLTEETVIKLADFLSEKEKEYEHPVYLISDEPYRELVYGDVFVPYLPNYYDNTVVCYSYSKSLSLAGERIGYILVSPKAKDTVAVFKSICGAGRALGYVCAPALMQRVIKACQGQTSDLAVYSENRSLLYDALTSYGFEAVKPDGAFYLFVKSPEPDANAFSARAKEHELLIVPSDSFGCPGYVRISYCVSTEMIKRSLPAFSALAESYGLKKSNS